MAETPRPREAKARISKEAVVSPEYFDLAEASRLLEDAAALLAEAESGNDVGPETLTRRLLAEEELAGDAEAEERVSLAIASKETFYGEASALWLAMKEGFDRQDMALIRGAHAGLRTLALQQLGPGEAD